VISRIFAFILFVSAVVALHAREIHPRYDFEGRIGYLEVCGTCGGQTPWKPEPKVEILADSILPVMRFGSGNLEGGLYGKAAAFQGAFQGASGMLLGWDLKRVEILAFLGLAYADKRVSDVQRRLVVYEGQTRNTFDLAVSLRFPISEDVRITTTYGHNSNGSAIGLNVLRLPGANPGLDSIMLGASVVLR